MIGQKWRSHSLFGEKMAKKWRSKSLFGEMESLFGENGEKLAKKWRRTWRT